MRDSLRCGDSEHGDPLAAGERALDSRSMEGERPSSTLLLRRDPTHRPMDGLALARGLPESAWETVTWRRGLEGSALLSICACGGSRGPSRLQSTDPSACRVAVGRVARTGIRADQILVVDPAPRDLDGDAGSPSLRSDGGLSRLRGTEAGVRAGPVRGAGVAWLPSSRHFMHRSVWVPLLDEPTLPPRPLAFLSAPRLPRGFRPEDLLIRPERHVRVAQSRRSDLCTNLAPGPSVRMVWKGILV